MGSLNLKNELYDPIRKKWVDETPEELIRQALILQMIEELGFPPSLLAIEKELYLLPHLNLGEKREIPKRRADLIAFAHGIHPDYAIFPLLMIECKAVDLTPKFAQQVIGYNAYVQAPFISLANGKQILTGFFDKEAGMYRFEPGLHSFKALADKVSLDVKRDRDEMVRF